VLFFASRPWNPSASTPSPPTFRIWPAEPPSSGGIFDFDTKRRRLVEVSALIEDPGIWADRERAQELGKERKLLEGTVGSLERIGTGLRDAEELYELARAENDEATLAAVDRDL